MKVAHFSDLHVMDARLDGEHGHMATLDRAVHAMFDHKPDLVVVCGDLAGQEVPHRATPRERKYLTETFRLMAEAAPVVVVRGNHDAPDDWYFLNFLQADHPIIYVEEPELLQPTQDFAVLALPWLDRAQYPAEASYAECVRTDYLGVINQLQADIRALHRDHKPVFVAVHGAFSSAMLRDGQPSVPTQDPVLDVKDLLGAAPFEALFAGHYHLGQQIGSGRAWYSGSVFVSQFGEDCPKHFHIYDTTTKMVERISVEQPARIKVQLDLERERVASVSPDNACPIHAGTPLSRLADGFKGESSPVRIKIAARYSEDKRQVCDHLIRQAQADLRPVVAQVVLDVHVDRTPRLRESALEVAKAPTMIDKILAFARSRQPTPPQGTLDRAKALFHDIYEAMV